MPTLTQISIKTSLIYLLAALVLGVLLAIQPLMPSGVPFAVLLGTLRPVYLHLLIVGWLTQLIIGVMYWMFPKYSKEHPRGSTSLGWASYIALNIGLLMRVVGEPLLVLYSASIGGVLLFLSALLQCGAAWGVFGNTWARVKER
jgi:cbb3-type cytochrome oxidase subunit 1